MKIKGRFCERTVKPKGAFDRRSFRYKQSGSSWLLIGCPKGKYQPRKGTCSVGTQAHKILARSGGGACRPGHKIKKG